MAASLSLLRQRISKTFIRDVSLLHRFQQTVSISSVVAKDLNSTKIVSREDEAVVEVVEYPEVKPKYPNGEWGDIEPTYAWLWQESINNLTQITDVEERQKWILSKGMSHLNALPHSDHPNYLEFAKYVTKTAMHPWSKSEPELEQQNQSQKKDSIDIGIAQLKHLSADEKLFTNVKAMIIDHILMEHEAVKRDFMDKKETYRSARRKASLLLRGFVDSVITSQSEIASHLRMCQYDEDVIVRAVWERYGFERNRRKRTGPDSFEVIKVSDYRVTSSCVFDGMIRSHLPLPEFQPREGGLSTSSEKPCLKYKAASYGVTKVPDHTLNSILAGHILGDPCEFGLVGVLLADNFSILDNKFGPKVAKECRLGRALTSTFTWLAAQAYNQGFSGLVDLTYPLTSQTVMSDGRNFSFLACQLNTLELWKPDNANNIANLCWHSDEMTLYDCVEKGKVKGFNDDALKMLMMVLQLEPKERGYDMKPTIPEKPVDLHKKSDFIPEKVEILKEEKEEEYIV